MLRLEVKRLCGARVFDIESDIPKSDVHMQRFKRLNVTGRWWCSRAKRAGKVMHMLITTITMSPFRFGGYAPHAM